MLALSRRAEQQFVFPSLGIRVRILQVRGRLVKIGVEAPRDIKVLRTEVCEADHSVDTEHRLRKGEVGKLALPDSAGKPRRLLVVEDSDNERRLMAYLLATHGFDVDVARDGVEAWEQLNNGWNRPSIVLMDMDLPLGNGLEILLKIREHRSLCELPVFAVTGSPRSAEFEPLGHGWDGWFQKPLDIAALLTKLSEFQAGSAEVSAETLAEAT